MGWDGLGRVGSKFSHLQRWVESGWVSQLGWIGSHKMDPWTTLVCRQLKLLTRYTKLSELMCCKLKRKINSLI